MALPALTCSSCGLLSLGWKETPAHPPTHTHSQSGGPERRATVPLEAPGRAHTLVSVVLGVRPGSHLGCEPLGLRLSRSRASPSLALGRAGQLLAGPAPLGLVHAVPRTASSADPGPCPGFLGASWPQRQAQDGRFASGGGGAPAQPRVPEAESSTLLPRPPLHGAGGGPLVCEAHPSTEVVRLSPRL